MPDTARRYDLIVDDQVDERYHFEKSTDAAISYLSDLYEIF
jgi:membrane-bound lytic murein transglycosylase D